MLGCFTCLPTWCTFTCVTITFFSIYVAFLTKTLSDVLIPGGFAGYTIEKNTKTYNPFWKSGQLLEIKIYLSLKEIPVSANVLQNMPSLTEFSTQLALAPPNDNGDDNATKDFTQEMASFTKNQRALQRTSSILLWETKGITFDWENTSQATHNVNLTSLNIPSKLWRTALSGKTLWVHAYVGHVGRNMKNTNDYKFVYSKTSTTKNTVKKAIPPTWRLFPAFCTICGESDAPIGPPDVLPSSAIRDAPPSPHWKPRAAFRYVADFRRYPRDEIPPLMAPHFRINRNSEYLPFSFADEVGLTTDKLIALNNTVTMLPLELDVSPSSLGRWQLGALMDNSISIMHNQMGAEAKDSDELRYMLTETHPYVLLLTLCVSLLHTLFDALAFKSDIQFWRELKTLRGLSTRGVVTSFICQIVIVAYLHHQETSKLVLFPAAFAVLLQAWKTYKVLTGSLLVVKVEKKEKKEKEEKEGEEGGKQIEAVRLKAEAKAVASKKEEEEGLSVTQHYDRVAGTYLGQALYPLVVGSTLYSLFCARHSGNYDWFITSAVGAVYTFGFIAMTPQLFINYKLRSVAHLPWKFLMFRALNTFIDDLFAFIIRMPTMHRLSCFRDDIVFFIYLYQRWCYPVDTARAAVGVESKETESSKSGDTKDGTDDTVNTPVLSSVPASDAKDAISKKNR